MTDFSRLKHLLEIWYRNELYVEVGSSRRLKTEQREFLMQAINAEQASLGMNDAPPDVTAFVRQGVEETERQMSSAEQINQIHAEATAEVQKHLDMVRTTIPSQGLRPLRCSETEWGTADANATIKRHILYNTAPHTPPLPNWYDAQREGPYEEPSPTYTPPDGEGMYDFRFLVNPVAPATSEPQWRKLWRRFVQDAQRAKRQSTYFSSKWGVQELEDLRLATIDEFYEDAAQQPEPPVPDWTERARDKAAQWVGDDHPWYAAYVDAVRERLVADATQRGEDLSLETLKKREVHEREGKANDLFVWRIVVVHLRTLRSIGCSPDAPVTTCFEMEALVQTVAHLLKYRRCIRWAKSIYKTAGLGSLHDQYRSGLLNEMCAHEHLDQSDTELGIARRMIRQAHVANHVHYQYAKPQKSNRDAVGSDVQCMIDGKKGDVYRTDAYYVNPPMAPILCASPPRMGKTAMSLLVASFAAKLGGNVMYATWPHKNVAVAEVNAMIDALGWRTQNLGDGVRVYPHDEPASVEDVSKRVHQLANNVTSWVLHIRDQAHALTRDRSNAQMKMHAENTYPLFYGMNMCVSATLLPTLAFKQLMGSDDSIIDLLKACYGGDRVTRREREQCVVLQPWSFPIGPDCLVPPKTHFPLYGPMEPWYRKYYGDPVNRTASYYGTWLHTNLNQARLLSRTGVLIDDALVRAMAKNQNWISTDLGNFTDDGSGMSPYKPTDAYATYLKHFNKHSTKYWNEQAHAWESGAPPRVVNAPIACLTDDAARILRQAEQWLDHGFLSHQSRNGESHKLHPMLLTAPIEQAQYKHKNGDLDWAVLLCKLAWLRMHKDCVNRRIRRDISPNQLAERYGISVLVRVSTNQVDRFVDVVAKHDDIRGDVENASVLAVTFDPRLAENRFRNYGFTHAEFSEGRLLPSALIPTLDAADIDTYRQAFHAASQVGMGLSAYNFLRDGYGDGTYRAIRTRLYRFDMRQCYSREGCGPQDEDVSESDLFNGETEEEEERQRVREQNESDEVDAYYDVPEAGELPEWVPQDEYAPMPAGAELDTDDQMTGDCDRSDMAIGNNNEAPKITNLNGIALRLCMSGSPDAQTAIEGAMRQCGIQKVAVVGFKMFEGGSTQATLRLDGATHHFVPRFMSIAPNQSNSRDLSQLYQLIGRGFVDMQGLQLPTSWRLDLLATSGTRKLCRLYGNAELLLGQIRNESVEGRKLTLGTALGSIGNREYRPVLDEPLEGDTSTRSGRGEKPMRDALGVATGYHRPFHTVRDCLSGYDAPTRKQDLPPEELVPDALDILNDDMSIRAECLVDAPKQATLAVEQYEPAGDDGYDDGDDDGSDAAGTVVAGMAQGMARLLADD